MNVFYTFLAISVGCCVLAMILSAVASREDKEKIKDLNIASVVFLVIGFIAFTFAVWNGYRKLNVLGKTL